MAEAAYTPRLRAEYDAKIRTEMTEKFGYENVMYLALIVFFAFFYTAIVFNPTETADNLKKHGDDG